MPVFGIFLCFKAGVYVCCITDLESQRSQLAPLVLTSLPRTGMRLKISFLTSNFLFLQLKGMMEGGKTDSPTSEALLKKVRSQSSTALHNLQQQVS
jgi:hypothetical protein